jgi:hypothetical protein
LIIDYYDRRGQIINYQYSIKIRGGCATDWQAEKNNRSFSTLPDYAVYLYAYTDTPNGLPGKRI